MDLKKKKEVKDQQKLKQYWDSTKRKLSQKKQQWEGTDSSHITIHLNGASYQQSQNTQNLNRKTKETKNQKIKRTLIILALITQKSRQKKAKTPRLRTTSQGLTGGTRVPPFEALSPAHPSASVSVGG
eukprot:GCRY01008946.1.p1 GENE.GCRY01008946.1~~GCRY01008946.1.p1  ORF type:complete len:128 (+),score=1.79 GCRY01008946.1:87-470(+)